MWAQTRVNTYEGNKYFLSLIDGYSRKVWMYLLKIKDEANVLEILKNWKALVENQTNRRLKVLRIDNGLECCNESFKNLCKIMVF